MDEKIRSCVLTLYKIGAVKFGSFTLKSGILSPIYIDLRLIISYPELLQQIADLMWKKVEHLHFDRIVGVPYTALPIATALSLKHNIPMLMKRKEAKDYGTKKLIEGTIEPGHTCLIIEDLVTSGASVFETIEPLQQEGLKVEDIVVLLDREQGGRKNVEQKGMRLHAVLTINDLLAVLKKEGKISSSTINEVNAFLRENQC